MDMDQSGQISRAEFIAYFTINDCKVAISEEKEIVVNQKWKQPSQAPMKKLVDQKTNWWEPMTEARKEELGEVFDMCDGNEDGELSKAEIQKSVKNNKDIALMLRIPTLSENYLE